MKQKVKDALRSVLEDVKDHEAETEFSAVSVDLAELKLVLRWAQNNAHVWFEGDRVRTVGVKTPYSWLNVTEGFVEGTVYNDSVEGRVFVEWDNAPEAFRRVEMFHDEIKRVK